MFTQRLVILFSLTVLYQNWLTAQVIVKGTVYDKIYMQPLAAVSVLSTMGNGTTTDSLGAYTIVIRATDSLWFSYLNKPTAKYAVGALSNKEAFDIALHVPVTWLKEIKIIPRLYQSDSLQNRQAYERIFNYRKPGIALTRPAPGGLGVGLDLNELIGMFQFGKNRRLLAFQQRLVKEEEDKYVDHRFNKKWVRKITGLPNQQLEVFMIRYRPTYQFVQHASDYELASYIKRSWQLFTQKKE